MKTCEPNEISFPLDLLPLHRMFFCSITSLHSCSFFLEPKYNSEQLFMGTYELPYITLNFVSYVTINFLCFYFVNLPYI